MVGIRMNGTIGVHVKLLATFVRLRVQNSIQRRRSALSNLGPHWQTTIIGQHNIMPILIQQVHREPAVKPTGRLKGCLLYTSPSPRDATLSRMPSSA